MAKKIVEIEVSEGIPHLVFIPKGIRIVVTDYDGNDEEYLCDKDADGIPCHIYVWEA